MASPTNGPRTLDYYKVLGVEPTADVNTIRRQRNLLALQYHPDKTSGNADALAKFKIIQEAYECLVNPATRDSYDNPRPFAETEAETAFDSDYADDDIDQKIWDDWHASSTGEKGSASSRAEQNHQTRTHFDYSSTPVSPGSSGSQQYSVFLTPDNAASNATLTPPTPGPNAGYIWISSDEDEDEQEGDDQEDYQEEPAEEDQIPYHKETSTLSTPVASHWSFFDYFQDDLTEKPLLPEMRDTVITARQKWRDACKLSDYAKVDLKYSSSPEEKTRLQWEYDESCKKRDAWANLKREREKNVRIHENIAKERMRAHKKKSKEDATAARKAQSRATQSSSRRQGRDRKPPVNVFNSFKSKKFVPWRRDAEESEDEWTAKGIWAP